ncbi:DMT family transporter [Frigidibacter sp. ROC022]|uniref:DMT family transporter n=1 Tax=Frigidibacter sp. ROC022 TaxID=2971796 RepID=UPI00215B30C1|nr:DMT family transporter [Frigidibacter sp. ROC022]MCR8722674.1 DMT family transporter [Frigidibacter sp. ROC022]
MPQPIRPVAARRMLDLALAFGSGGILTLMILCNGTVAGVTNGHFASLAAHGTGTVAALAFLALLPRRRSGAGPGRAPLWAYLGGLAGAVTVIVGSIAMNSALALSGMLALGLAGQTAFSLAVDRFGWFGMPRRSPDLRDAATVVLILAGCLVIIFGGTGG